MLPSELVDHIFSFLRGDRSALEECSKAHPMLSRLAEPYIYADNRIDVIDEKSLSELYTLLSENPHILKFARTLKILHCDYTYSRLGADPLLMMIPQMTNLVSLSLENFGWSYGHSNENLFSTFRTFLRQSTIEELCLNSVKYFPFSILDNCKNLRKLTLIECSAMSEAEPISASASPHRFLETLVFVGGLRPPDSRGGPSFDLNLLQWATHRATGLTTLELRSAFFYGTNFAPLLEACSNSLTSLVLEIGSQCTKYPSLFPFEFTYYIS
jgi:hypothetical protein